MNVRVASLTSVESMVMMIVGEIINGAACNASHAAEPYE